MLHCSMTGSVSMILLLGLSSALLIFTQALYVEEQIEIIKDICEDYEVTLADSVICRILSRPADSHQSDSEGKRTDIFILIRIS